MLAMGGIVGTVLGAPFKIVGGVLGGIAGSAAGDIIGAVAKAIMQSLNQAIETVGTLWVNVGTPNLTSTAGGSQPSDAGFRPLAPKCTRAQSP